ncbi:MAG: lysylphosphatidylglycerol synthase transmembrane domain-containing protein, partial [Pseudohongiellaceae bacterium]
CVFLSLFARVRRWGFVVHATEPASFRDMFTATQTGMLVNCVAPARLGDVVRAFVFARQTRMPLARSLTLVALDRINDVIALVAVLVFALATFPVEAGIEFPPGAFGNAETIFVSNEIIRPAALSLIVVLLAAVATLVVLYFNRDLVLHALAKILGRVSPRTAGWLKKLFVDFYDGMHVFRSPLQMARAIAWSFITWGLVALSVYLLLRGFHIDAHWHVPLLILAILGVFTSVTVTPGMIGQYHVPFVAGVLIALPGQDVNVVKAASILAHLTALLPVVILGVLSMVYGRLGFFDLVPGKGGER